MNFSHHFLVLHRQEQLSSANRPRYNIVGVLPLSVISESSKENVRSHNHVLYKTWKMVAVLQRTAEKPTRLYFAHSVLLFCSLTLLFGGILRDVAVVIFLYNLFSCVFRPERTSMQVKAMAKLKQEGNIDEVLFL